MRGGASNAVTVVVIAAVVVVILLLALYFASRRTAAQRSEEQRERSREEFGFEYERGTAHQGRSRGALGRRRGRGLRGVNEDLRQAIRRYRAVYERLVQP